MLSRNEKDDNARLFCSRSPRVSAPAYLRQTKRPSTSFSSSTNVSSSKSPSSTPRKGTSMSPSSSPMLLHQSYQLSAQASLLQVTIKLSQLISIKEPSTSPSKSPAHLYGRVQHISIKEHSTTVQPYPICHPYQVFTMPTLKTPSKSALRSPSTLPSKSLSVSPLNSTTVSPVVLYELFRMSMRKVVNVCGRCGHSSA